MNFLVVMGIIGICLWLMLRKMPSSLFRQVSNPESSVTPETQLFNAERIRWSEGVFDRGLRFVKVGDHYSAMLDFIRVVEVRPRWAEPHYHLALAYLNLRQQDKARKQLEILRGLDPSLANQLDEQMTRFAR